MMLLSSLHVLFLIERGFVQLAVCAQPIQVYQKRVLEIGNSLCMREFGEEAVGVVVSWLSAETDYDFADDAAEIEDVDRHAGKIGVEVVLQLYKLEAGDLEENLVCLDQLVGNVNYNGGADHISDSKWIPFHEKSNFVYASCVSDCLGNS